MTVAAQPSVVVYSLSGTNLGPFNTTFGYEQDSDVQVNVDTGSGDVVQGSGDYTLVDGTAPTTSSGGSVTLASSVLAAAGGSWPSGSRITLVRTTSDDQPMALGSAQGFSPQAYEAALDHIERQLQDTRAILAQALCLPWGDRQSASWPPAAERKGLVLCGDPVTGAPVWAVPTFNVVPSNGESQTAVTIAAATTLQLKAAASAYVYVSGQTTLDGNGKPAQITSFGPCSPGDPPIWVRFEEANWLGFDGVNLECGPNTPLNINAGGMVLAKPSATTGLWDVSVDIVSQLWLKASYGDQEDATHAQAMQVGSPNFASTTFPDWLHDGSDSVSKNLIKALWIGCAENYPQLGYNLANGTSLSFTNPVAGACAEVYVWACNSDGTFDTTYGLDCLNNTGGLVSGQYYDYIGRPWLHQPGCYDVPTLTTRAGYESIALCAQNEVAPKVVYQAEPNGGVVFAGRCNRGDGTWDYTLDAAHGYLYPVPNSTASSYGQYAGPAGRSLSPGGLNPAETQFSANIALSCSDYSNFSAIAFRKWGAWWTTGVDFAFANSNNALRVGFLVSSSMTWSMEFNPGGYFAPVADGGAALGASGQRFSGLYAQAAVVQRPSDGTVLQVESDSSSFDSDGILINVPDMSSVGTFNLLRGRVGGGNVYRVDGTGKGFFDGGTATSGAGFGEMFEWADGNPEGQDRMGWTVVLQDGMIRRATPGDDPASIIGVVSARVAFLGDAMSERWAGMYELDDFGRRIHDEVETISWSEELFEEHELDRARQATYVEKRLRTVTRTVKRLVEQVVKVGDKHCLVTREHAQPHKAAVTEEVPLHDADGKPTGRTHRAPVYDEVQDQRREIYRETARVKVGVKHHNYRVGKIPEVVTVPPDAVRKTVKVARVSAAHDPSRPYVGRLERPEWDAISYSGKERVLKGEAMGKGWLKIRDVSASVEEWLVRAGG